MSGLCRKQEDFLAVDATPTPVPHLSWGGSLLSGATQVSRGFSTYWLLDADSWHTAWVMCSVMIRCNYLCSVYVVCLWWYWSLSHRCVACVVSHIFLVNVHV